MTSHASVNVMLALEDRFDIEFPDRMLNRSVFESIAAIERALLELGAGQRRHERRRRPGPGVSQPIGRIADEVAAPNADEVDREARFPAEAIEALRAAGAVGDGAGRARRGGVAASRRSRPPARARPPLRLDGDGVRDAPDPGRLDRPPPRRRAVVRVLPAAVVDRDQRLIASATSEVGTGGDMGRSIAAVTPAEGGCCTFEKQAPTVSYGATRTTSS